MHILATNRSRLLSLRLLGRCFWIAMLVLHAPALFSAFTRMLESGPNPAALGGLAALAITTVFFVLKLRGTRFLKFGNDRRTFAILAVAVTLLHADVIGAHLNQPIVPKDLPLAGAPLLMTGLARVQHLAGTLFQRRRNGRRPHRPTGPVVDSARVEAFAPHLWLAAGCLSVPRAPPA